MSDRGAVYDLGYTPYSGERLGRRGAIAATYRDGNYRVLGIKRRARKKILPWSLAILVMVPAVVFVGFSFLLSSFSPDADSPFANQQERPEGERRRRESILVPQPKIMGSACGAHFFSRGQG